MHRTLDSIIARKKSLRVWRFRKRTPDLLLTYTAPSPVVFSPWTKRLGFLAAVFLSPALAFSFSTNAAFSDDDQIRSNGIGTGEWMPDIHLEEKHGCVRLSSSIPSARIYYKFSDDGNPRTNGDIFDGECNKIPEGKHIDFEARAFHADNDEWRSEILRKTFSQRSEEKESGKESRDDESDRDQERAKREHDEVETFDVSETTEKQEMLDLNDSETPKEPSLSDTTDYTNDSGADASVLTHEKEDNLEEEYSGEDSSPEER